MLGIKINDEVIQGNYTLNLNEEEGNEFEIEVVSADDRGRSYRWAIDYNADPNNVITKYNYPNKINVIIDLKGYKEQNFIKLRNVNGDEFDLFIEPNEEASRDKIYTFKLGKYTLEENTYTFNIISKESKYKLDWDIQYKGEPLPLTVTKENNKLIVSFTDDMKFLYMGMIVLKQKESDNELTLHFKTHDNGFVEFYEEE